MGTMNRRYAPREPEPVGWSSHMAIMGLTAPTMGTWRKGLTAESAFKKAQDIAAQYVPEIPREPEFVDIERIPLNTGIGFDIMSKAKDTRLMLGIPITHMAAQMGIHESTVAGYENMRSKSIPIDRLVKFADILHLNGL